MERVANKLGVLPGESVQCHKMITCPCSGVQSGVLGACHDADLHSDIEAPPGSHPWRRNLKQKTDQRRGDWRATGGAWPY
jgi:hypothetical protein